MRYFQNNIGRLMAFIIAFQILNMSIDAPSAQMPVNSGNDDFNYIDTFVEYVVEVVLKYDNAIPESKDRQQKELQQHKQFEVAFEKVYSLLRFYRQNNSTDYKNFSDKYAYQFIKEINPPPPKV
jgi:hypothetical protein